MSTNLPKENSTATPESTNANFLERSGHSAEPQLTGISSPSGDIGNLGLADIIDVPTIQSLMESFYELSRLPMGIIDDKGTLLACVGWQKVCAEFHSDRANRESYNHCLASETQPSFDAGAGEFLLSKCKHNLWTAAFPIKVAGRNLGHLICAQFFLEGETPNWELFRTQARKYGFDENAYLAALEDAPRVSRETVNTVMDFSMRLANRLSQSAYTNFALRRSLAERDREIAERQKAEQLLRESERRFRQLIEDAPLGILISSGGVIQYSNSSGLAFFGAERPEQIVGKAPFERVHPDSSAIVKECARRVEGEKKCILSAKEKYLRLDGSTFDVEVSASPFIFDNRDGAILFFRDITQQEQTEIEKRVLENELRHAQKMEAVGRLAGGIAHDFNNLLMIIRSYSEMLRERLPADTELQHNTREIMKAADRAASLTKQLLAFSRKQVVCPVMLDLNAVINDGATLIRRIIGEDIDFRLSLTEPLWTTEADTDQIVQVLMNLSVNARDAMPQGGTLTISTENVTVSTNTASEHPLVAAGDYVRLTVRDTGTGISKELQERIFEPFFTTKDVGKGTGLGLPTVYGIVKHSRGYLWLDSEIGQGACFTIYFPMVKGTAPPQTIAKSKVQMSGKETILVVEDEATLQEVICEYLRSSGYTVLSANSGRHAISVACDYEGKIDLLLTDLVMPKMSGRELSQLLVDTRPNLKMIYMSGYTDDEVLQHGLKDAGGAFLQKPFTFEAMARKVREILGSAGKFK